MYNKRIKILITIFSLIGSPLLAGTQDLLLGEPGPDFSSQKTQNTKIRVMVVSGQEAVLSSRIFATVNTLYVKETSSFKRGGLLVSFDCSELIAQKSVAEAQVKLQQTTNTANLELFDEKVVGELEKDLSGIRVEEALANLAVVNTRLKYCKIPAPFSGEVVELHTHAHETLQPGDPVMHIQNTKKLEMHMLVPSDWVVKISPGNPFQVSIEETGQSYHGTITALGPRIDAVSRTVKVYAKFNELHPELKPGMSGYAEFELK